MDQAGVQVLKKVHVRGAEAWVVIEVISGGDGEGDLRQLHHSDLTRSHQEEGGDRDRALTGKLGSQRETGVPEGNWGSERKRLQAGSKTTAVGGLRKRTAKLHQRNVKLVWTLRAHLIL